MPNIHWGAITKGRIIGVLIIIILAPVAALVVYLTWMYAHPNDTFIGVGIEEVMADRALLDIDVYYDRHSEMNPETYADNAADAIYAMLIESGITRDQISRPYSSSLEVYGYRSDDGFAAMDAMTTRILTLYPETRITTHYTYALTPQVKSSAFIKAIKNADEQAELFAAAENRTLLYNGSTMCKIAVIDSTQAYNPTSCSAVPAEGEVTDLSRWKHVVATVESTAVFSF